MQTDPKRSEWIYRDIIIARALYVMNMFTTLSLGVSAVSSLLAQDIFLNADEVF